MAADLQPDEAVERKSVYFGAWLRGESGRWAQIASVDSACPQCGSPAVCAYANTGDAGTYHTFAHVCLSAACAWCEEHSQFEPNSGVGDEPPPACFFCGREV